MAIKATAAVTISIERDIASIWRFYQLSTSTTAPSAPTDAQGKTFINTTPKPTSIGNWATTEPSYTEGATNFLYITELTAFSDGTVNWSLVSKSSSYEAAKQAYNLAHTANNNAAEANNRLDADGVSSGNMLLDVYATTLAKVNGPSNRYLSDSNYSQTTGAFIAEANLPDPNATHFYRITYGNGRRGLTWYASNYIPFQEGQKYIIGCYARSSTGTRIQVYSSAVYGLGDGNAHSYTVPNDSQWRWYQWVVDFRESGSTSANYKKVYFYQGNSSSGNILDMCGWRCTLLEETVGDSDNLALKSNVSVTNNWYNIASYNLANNNLKTGDIVTVTIKGTLGSGKTGWAVYNSSSNIGLMTANEYTAINEHYYDAKDGTYKMTTTWINEHHNNSQYDITTPTSIKVFTYPSSVSVVSTIEWIKLERGSVATPWCLNSGEVEEVANKALTSANGKNKLYYQIQEPTPDTNNPFKVGDTWFKQGTVYAHDTKSDSIISFEDTEGNKTVENVKVAIEPVQAGSGNPSPTNIRAISGWTSATVTRSGRNQIPSVDFSVSYDSNGITWRRNADWSFTANGTKTGTAQARYEFICQRSGNYYFSGCPSGGSGSTYDIYMWDYARGGRAKRWNKTTDVASDYGTTANNEVYLEKGIHYAINCRVNTTSAVTNLTFYPMIRLDTESDSSYEPPVSSTYSITFPTGAGTVYGGELDVSKGELKVTHKRVDLGTCAWAYNSANKVFTTTFSDKKSPVSGVIDYICDSYKSNEPVMGYVNAVAGIQAILNSGYERHFLLKDTNYTDAATFKASLSGKYLVYALTTPTTYSLTPTQITTLLGQNNIWANTGDVTVTGAVAETTASTEVYKWDGSDWVLTPLADAAFATIDAGKITTGELRTIQLKGPNEDTYWDLSTGEWQSHGIRENVTYQYYHPTLQEIVTAEWDIATNVNINDGIYEVSGSHDNKSTVYATFGINGSSEDNISLVDDDYEPWAYASLELRGDNTIGHVYVWDDTTDTAVEKACTYNPIATLEPNYLMLGGSENVDYDGKSEEETSDEDGAYQTNRNRLILHAGDSVKPTDSIEFVENCRWELIENSDGEYRRVFNDVMPRYYTPVWPYMPGDVEYYPTGDDYRIVCNGYMTDSKGSIWFSIPLTRPVSEYVTSVKLSCQLKARCQGTYSIGGSGSKANITSYNCMCHISPSGLNVRLQPKSGSFSGTNNYSVSVDVYNLEITFG